MMLSRRTFNGGVVSALAISVIPGRTARAAGYPERPVSLITPAPASGGPDVIARIMADRLSQLWQEQIVIVNRPGGGGLIGLRAAAAAKPDGYTLYMPLSSTFVALPEMHPKLPIDLKRDIVPIGLVGEQPMAFAVNAKLGVSTLRELVAFSKTRQQGILYGGSRGSVPSLAAEMLQQRAGIRLTFVPYPNTARATQDAAAGTVELAVESLSGLSGLIQSGMLSPLAVASAKRVPDFADLPTVAETLPEVGHFEARGWFVLAAPRGTPGEIVRKVNADLNVVLSQTDVQKKFASLGTYARPISSAETVAFIDSEQALWRPIVRQVLTPTR